MKTKGTRVHKGISNVKRNKPRETIHNATFEPNNGSGKNYSNVLVIGIIVFGIILWAMYCK